ncbi:peroxisome biogenesis factor 10 isoform X3 [Tyto alba]|uniref:peroxisome biogenesis factor 10 isoform X3 n=1 Tax=Tyto alba TaxID=56313 RepID=UPI001C6776DA|nr:peroxisome biogenesis factor 10 isoform X3 [Tyto alba]
MTPPPALPAPQRGSDEPGLNRLRDRVKNRAEGSSQGRVAQEQDRAAGHPPNGTSGKPQPQTLRHPPQRTRREAAPPLLRHLLRHPPFPAVTSLRPASAPPHTMAAAGPARLVRCGQKDEVYRGGLRSAAGTALHGLAGARKWLEWRKELELLSDVAYFVLTTLSGYQTLGEEYVNIVQVDSTKKRIPSFLRRAIFISLHTVVPYCLEKGLLHLEHELQIEADELRASQSSPALGLSSRTLIRNWIQKQAGELTEQQKKRLLQIVYLLKQCIPLLHRLHLAIFYIRGTFYHLSKRITGITYVSGFISCYGIHCSILASWGVMYAKRIQNLAVTDYNRGRLGEGET